MPKFRGEKNLHVGDDIHAERDYDGGGYVIDVDAKTAKSLQEYLAGEGFTPAEDEPEPAEPEPAS
jgi:hypothetical protein